MSTPDYSRTRFVNAAERIRLYELGIKSDTDMAEFLGQFGIPTISGLPADQFDAAVQWLYRRINRCTICDGTGRDPEVVTGFG